MHKQSISLFSLLLLISSTPSVHSSSSTPTTPGSSTSEQILIKRNRILTQEEIDNQKAYAEEARKKLEREKKLKTEVKKRDITPNLANLLASLSGATDQSEVAKSDEANQ